MKTIAITSNTLSKDNKVNSAYIEAFSNSETLTIITPTIVDEILDHQIEEKIKEYKEKAKEIAKICDALVLSGGSDISPLIYDKKNYNSVGCNTKRDRSDAYLLEAFIEAKKPIMGICKGMQILGLYFKLPNFKQNLDDYEELHNAENHDLSRQEFAHKVNVYGSLEKELKTKEFGVNSFHHQGFAYLDRKSADGKTRTINIGKEIEKIEKETDLNILAGSDRIIEAFEHKILPIFAVQWHPEEYGNKSIIINYFINKYLK